MERFVTYGVVADMVLAVVWTPRGDAIRLISARKANEDELKAYHAAVAGPEPDIA
ncbi:BrnT family toxin [Asticcacaulis sp.]|uniref:BrnT family toxin n=1 Tax=Asticcacaulis sp. TaxID=1872648 RepID=UPI002632C27B|nr:BrnT family toxin [Asticcacaulis sp.]